MVHVAAWQITDTVGTHNKYYRAYVAGGRVVFQYGRIGTVQSTQVRDQNPAAAIKTAGNKLASKLNDRSKHYVQDGPTLRLDVSVEAWTDPAAHAYELDWAYAGGRAAGLTLAGSLSDGSAHVVALVGTGKLSPSTRLDAWAAASATHPQLDVTLAVLDAAAAAQADRTLEPRVALLDLGAAEDTDSHDVLASALRLWTPDTGSAPQAHLQVSLENARMIFAPSAE